jgi:glyoxylase-like metal-dependent hydrolase (beta-lactamase superfamily II)
MHVKEFFDKDTATFTYVVADISKGRCAIIDPVLDFDAPSGNITTGSADAVVEYIHKMDWKVDWILETHAHADHLTASAYLKKKLGGTVGIGERIVDVLETWVPVFDAQGNIPTDGRQFDTLFKEGDVFSVGDMQVRVMHTPGHTPACVSYLVQDAVFVGDTVFMPHMGSARTDFPGGDAAVLYRSIQRILGLPKETKVYVGHDYPKAGEEASCMATVAQQNEHNVMVKKGICEADFVQERRKRDTGKAVPRLLLPSLQVNIQAGHVRAADSSGRCFLKIPLKVPECLILQ